VNWGPPISFIGATFSFPPRTGRPRFAFRVSAPKTQQGILGMGCADWNQLVRCLWESTMWDRPKSWEYLGCFNPRKWGFTTCLTDFKIDDGLKWEPSQQLYIVILVLSWELFCLFLSAVYHNECGVVFHPIQWVWRFAPKKVCFYTFRFVWTCWTPVFADDYHHVSNPKVALSTIPWTCYPHFCGSNPLWSIQIPLRLRSLLAGFNIVSTLQTNQKKAQRAARWISVSTIVPTWKCWVPMTLAYINDSWWSSPMFFNVWRFPSAESFEKRLLWPCVGPRTSLICCCGCTKSSQGAPAVLGNWRSLLFNLKSRHYDYDWLWIVYIEPYSTRKHLCKPVSLLLNSITQNPHGLVPFLVPRNIRHDDGEILWFPTS